MKLIHARTKLELAELVVKSAPPGARFFWIARKLKPMGFLVDYDPPTGDRLSVAKLGQELGIVGSWTEPLPRQPEPTEYKPSAATSLAVQQGKRGFVLLK